ncbi:MAG: cell division protein FtsQ/DivIB [Bacillota bacterium]
MTEHTGHVPVPEQEQQHIEEQEQIPERERRPENSPKPRKKHRRKNYLLRLIVALALIVAAVLCAHLDYFNVDGIAVIGNSEVSDEDIIKQSGLKTGGSVFDVHPLIVQHRIKKNLYIESVNVNRKLPDKVEIIVKERPLLAQFHKGDKFVITDSEGMVLDVSKEEHKTTIIEGITVTDADRKETIKVKENEKLEKALELLVAMDESDIYFKKIEFNGAKVDAYVYDSLKCSGKYDDLMSAITSGTLKKVIYDLYQKGTEKGTVNVYSNDYCFFTPK